MKRSLAHSFRFALFACVTALVVAPAANAAPLPKGFYPYVFHGKYAFGVDGRAPITRLNLQSGQSQGLNLPTDIFSSAEVASDTAIAGTTTTLHTPEQVKQRLVRFDVHSGLHALDSIIRWTDSCESSITPISIAEDGTVVAVTRVTVPVLPHGCGFDAKRSHVSQYVPSKEPRKVWMPSKYRSWLASDLIDANEDTLVIAKDASGGEPGAVVAIDMAKRKVIAKRRSGKVQSVSLANPHSLYLAQDGDREDGRVMYWRLGQRPAKSLFRGSFAASFSTNCGNRALVVHGRTLALLSRNGKVVLERRSSLDGGFANVVCSSKYLYFLDVEEFGGYDTDGKYSRRFINISRLP